MKKWLFCLCISSFLYSVEPPSQEVVALDLAPLVQQSISAQELQPPAPHFELPRRKNLSLAVGLSALAPGLGHVYLGDMKTAGSLMATTGLGISLASSPKMDNSVRLSSLVTAQNTWSYGIYAAYRDTRAFNGSSTYLYPMPTDSLTDLTSAPFRLSILKKPEVWGGLLGALALAVGASYVISFTEAHVLSASQSDLMPLLALPIGVGEESLFRGYLQSSLSETFASPWRGIAVSALAFGAMHIPNAFSLEPKERRGYYGLSLPLITGLGAYFGWLTYKNRSLQESVAIHTWYDFVLFSAGALASRAAITGRSQFALAIPF